MSKLIVIEGPDRVGKATQTRMLRQYLVNKGFVVAAAEVPLKSNFMYHLIYWMLGNGLSKKFPKAFQWCQYFNRQIFQWTILPKLEEECDYIIMDRWSLSSVVYGSACNVPREFTEVLYNRLRDPDFTIVLLGPAHAHEAEDVYEADSDLQHKVREIYREWVTERPGKFSIVDCSRPIEVVAKDIKECLELSGVLDP
jgi:dTMP kinase